MIVWLSYESLRWTDWYTTLSNAHLRYSCYEHDEHMVHVFYQFSRPSDSSSSHIVLSRSSSSFHSASESILLAEDSAADALRNVCRQSSLLLDGWSVEEIDLIIHLLLNTSDWWRPSACWVQQGIRKFVWERILSTVKSPSSKKYRHRGKETQHQCPF